MQLQILDVNYIIDRSGSPVIQLFGVDKYGNNEIIKVHGFKPYFYAFPDQEVIEDAIDVIEHHDLEVDIVERFLPIGYQTYPVQMLKIYTKNPKEIKMIRDEVLSLPHIKEIYEADVLFKDRFLIDSGLGGMQWFDATAYDMEYMDIKSIDVTDNSSLKKLSFDIECLPDENNEFPKAEKDQIILISMSFDPEYRGLKDLVLVAKPYKCHRPDTIFCKDEYEILNKFIEIFNDYDPSIVLTYNGSSYDIPYLNTRMNSYGINPRFGRDGNLWYINEFNGVTTVTMNGRIHVDLLPIMRRDYSLQYYSLAFVSKELIKINKLDVSPDLMREYWLDLDKKFKKFISYSRRDAILTMSLFNKLRYMDKFTALSKISHALMQDIVSGGQTKRILSLMYRKFREEDRVIGMKPVNVSDSENSEYQGAYVLDTIPGPHEHIVVNDFTSLYVTIIIANNICPSTLIVDEYPPGEVIKSPDGGSFVSKDIKLGIMPSILQYLLDTRKEMKKKMKEASNENEKALFDAMQYATKLLGNAFYGFCGYKRSPLFNIMIASAVTSFGRENLMRTKDIIENKLSPVKLQNDKIIKLITVAGDTDSCMTKLVSDFDITYEDAEEVGNIIASEVSKNLPKPMALAFEMYCRRGIFLAKKRYSLLKIEKTKDGYKEGYKTKGIETVRRDWCKLVSNTMQTCLEKILKENDVHGAVDTVKKAVDLIRTADLSRDDTILPLITITHKFGKSIDEYKNKQPHIELVKKMIQRGEQKPGMGERIPFIVVQGKMKGTKQREQITSRAEDPQYAIEHGMVIDRNYYIQKQLIPPCLRLLSHFGYSAEDLSMDKRQKSILEFV